MDLERLRVEQKELAQKVLVPKNCEDGYMPHLQDIVFSLDIQYVGEVAYVAVDVRRLDGEELGLFVAKSRAGMEYVPRFFCFREGPPLLKTVEHIQEEYLLMPSLLIIDGHGIAHPRRLGVASWLGVQADLPAIGVAKKTLLPYEGDLAEQRGSSLPILLEGEQVGSVLRTQESTKPVFVSIGHNICLKEATNVILRLSRPYRLAESIRSADHIARVYAKGETAEGVTFIKIR